MVVSWKCAKRGRDASAWCWAGSSPGGKQWSGSGKRGPWQWAWELSPSEWLVELLPWQWEKFYSVCNAVRWDICSLILWYIKNLFLLLLVSQHWGFDSVRVYLEKNGMMWPCSHWSPSGTVKATKAAQAVVLWAEGRCGILAQWRLRTSSLQAP